MCNSQPMAVQQGRGLAHAYSFRSLGIFIVRRRKKCVCLCLCESNVLAMAESGESGERVGYITRVQSFSACHRLHR